MAKKKRGCAKGSVRDSSGDCRDYKAETRYESTPEQRQNRAARGRARKEMGLKVGDPREVDHKKPLNAGGHNGKSNLRITSRSFNRKRAAKARA
jgi:5-methylcytosine-specific restriction endonuclease McrA